MPRLYYILCLLLRQVCRHFVLVETEPKLVTLKAVECDIVLNICTKMAFMSIQANVELGRNFDLVYIIVLVHSRASTYST